MTEVVNNLSSAGWWISVVIVGLLINLVSAYIKAPIDSLGSKLSSAWRSRSERSLQQLNASIAAAVADPTNLAHLQYRALTYRSKSNGWLICMCIGLAFNSLDAILLALGQMHGHPFAGIRVPMPNGPIYFGILIGVSAIGAMRAASAAADSETVIERARRQLEKRPV